MAAERYSSSVRPAEGDNLPAGLQRTADRGRDTVGAVRVSREDVNVAVFLQASPTSVSSRVRPNRTTLRLLRPRPTSCERSLRDRLLRQDELPVVSGASVSRLLLRS